MFKKKFNKTFIYPKYSILKFYLKIYFMKHITPKIVNQKGLIQ